MAHGARLGKCLRAPFGLFESRDRALLSRSGSDSHSKTIKPSMTDVSIPAGFTPLKRIAPFLEMIGPIYVKSIEQKRIVAIRIAEKHLNMRRIVHGGMLVTLADSALGINLSYSQEPPRPMATVNL